MFDRGWKAISKTTLASAVCAALLTGFSTPAQASVVTTSTDDIVRPIDMTEETALSLAEEGSGVITPYGGPVVEQWLDKNKEVVFLRRDAAYKIKAHGLTPKPVRVVTQWANDVKQEGTSWVYRTQVGSPKAGWVMVRVVVDYRKYGPGDQTFGVVTAYCEGTQVCPAFVNSTVG